MKTKTMILTTLASAFFYNANAQQPPIITDTETPIVRPLKLDGPRLGATFLPGLSSSFEDEYGFEVAPVITQFGWQFEWRYFESEDGGAGLFELVPLVGGFEQGLFLPSLNALIGYRTGSGFEIGFGPNLSIAGAGATFAIGHTFQSQYMNFPVNFAVVPNQEGVRFTLLFGFNKRSR